MIKKVIKKMKQNKAVDKHLSMIAKYGSTRCKKKGGKLKWRNK